jgi:hypothetical protein
MRTFRSSIFSFDTLTACDPRGSGAWQTVVLAICLLAVAELGARSALTPIGAYWEYWTPRAAAKFERYRADVRRGTPPRLLAVGDSTGASDIEPAALADAAGVDTAFNLAWPANFPMAFRESTLPLLRSDAAPDVVVASFSPTGFLSSPRVERFEEAILSSPYVRALRGERQAADYSYLARLRPALPFRGSWWTGNGLPQPANGGFMPLTGADAAPDVGEEERPFERERFAVLEALREAGRQHGFEVVVVVPPRRDPSAVREGAEATYLSRLRQGGFTYLDFREPSFLQPAHFYDGGHLNRDGARIYSARLGEALRGKVPREVDSSH